MTGDQGSFIPNDPVGAKKRSSPLPWLVALALVAAAVVLVWVYWGGGEIPLADKTAQQAQPAGTAKQKAEKPAEPAAGAKPGAPAPPPKSGDKVVQVPMPGQPSPPAPGGEPKGAQAKPGAPQAAASKPGAPPSAKPGAKLQEERKRPYGLERSLDAVVRSDEVIKVGDKTIPVDELQRKLVVQQRGKMLDRPLDKPGRISVWGVHVVRPGENLWDIHFRLLREYMASRGVKLASRADQPTANGYSSGVGKVLKFAEHMVGVYNTQTKHMSRNLNLIEPGHKVVVYNLTEIFAQLAKINPNDLSGVMYDGRVLFFPEAKKAD